MKEFVLKGRLTLERVTFRVSAKTLEGALARAVNGDFDGYDTDAAESVDWHMALASIEENTLMGALTDACARRACNAAEAQRNRCVLE